MTENKFAELPEMCYGVLTSTNELIIIKRGESGYYKAYDDLSADEVDDYNETIGVTKGQRKAMEMGSMFGWNIPAANPAMYDSEGNFIRK
jgi:hypothetical protein